jgi:hypothetical protein
MSCFGLDLFSFEYSSAWLFEQPEQNEYEGIVHEERPGGFDWQNNRQ